MDIKTILQAVGKAYRDFAKAFEPHKTTDELFLSFKHSLEESLGEHELICDYIWGCDTLDVDGVTAAGYIPQKNDTLIMDISVGVGGMWCDVCRTFFVGEPSSEQAEAYETIISSLRAGHDALHEGALARDVYFAVNKVYEKAGKRLIHHAGHRIGASPLLQPQFLPENDVPIVLGETYTLETGLYENFGIRLENDYLIKKTGAEDLFEEILPLDIKEYILK